MKKNQIGRVVTRSILEEVGKCNGPILLDTKIKSLALDSLSVLCIQVDLENHFGIEIPEGGLEDMVTVGDIVNFVESEVLK